VVTLSSLGNEAQSLIRRLGMMDIEGLINTRDQGSLHLLTTPFSLSASNNLPSDPTSASSFTFPHLSPTTAEDTGFPDPDFSYQTHKRPSQDGTGNGLRPSRPGRNKASIQKGDLGRMSFAKDYPRRRALQACQICRTRKTKCDNERPSCGNCEVLGVECNYNEAPASKYLGIYRKS
jgi:hypothetical protein